MDAYLKTGQFPSPGFEASGQNFTNNLKSAVILIAAFFAGVTPWGWSHMRFYFGVSLVVGYAHVCYKMIFT